VISVILYGRNDSYGYNLHKRAALSLNCIAEVLDAEGDEILFVDYNTPDDFPTFPEAIRDTLTERAKRILRVLRVRPAHHRRFAALSHLVALEPVARNVAVRRSNPANRWLLSTNTDMIFVPRTGKSLSAIAAPLADGFYHLARCELPESLWETLDRRDAAGTIAQVGQWGRQFHLNELTTHELPYLRFDAPGDFQLMLRSDAHKLWGFDERMLIGYHVDSNIARRLHLLHGTCGDVEPDLFGYHCDHTRQVTPAHRHDAPENDLARFVLDLTDPYDCRHQAETWGLADAEIEDIRLDGSRVTYFDALAATITAPMDTPTRTEVGAAGIERTDYDPPHALPFLLDALVEYPRGSLLGWFGTRADTLALFAQAWRAAGFTAPILVPSDAPWLGAPLPESVTAADTPDIVTRAHLFVLDGGLPAGHHPAAPVQQTPQMRHVLRALSRIVADERQWMPHRAEIALRDALPAHLQAPRRVIGLNGFLNSWEQQFGAVIGAAKSPGSTRVRQGFVLPPPEGMVDLAALRPAHAGERVGKQIRLRPNRRGLVFIASRVGVPAGPWRFELEYAPALLPVPRPGPLKLEVVAGGRTLAHRYPLVNGLLPQTLTLDFTLPGDPEDPDAGTEILLRLHTVGLPAGTLTGARLVRPAVA
jgi:hypothetical protein